MADRVEDRANTAELEALDLAQTDVAVTGGVDAAIADVVSHRELVPTEREAELGATRRAFRFEEPPAAPRRGFKQLVRDYFKDINPSTIGGPRTPLLVVGAAALVTQWDDVAIAVLLPEMRSEFGFSLQFLLTLTSVMLFVKILISPAMGYLADRVKRVWMMRAGGILQNLGSILFGLAGGVPQLVAGRVAVGFGTATSEPASFPLITDYYPLRSRARVFAFTGFMGGLGAIIGPTIAGRLGDAFGWRFAVVGLGILAVIVSIGYFLLAEPVRGRMDRIEMGASEDVVESEQKPVSWGEAWRTASSISTVRRLWYVMPFLYVGFVGATQLIPLYYAQEFGLGASGRGYIQSAAGVAGLIGIMVAGPVADRLLVYRPGRIVTFVGGLYMLQGVAILVLIVSPFLPLSILLSIALGFGFVALQPATIALLSLVVPARVRGLGLQTIAPFQMIGLILVPLVATAADSWGLREGMLLLVPAWVIAGFVLGGAAFGVERDIRAAVAASMADEEARRARASGRSKMVICRDVDVSYDGVQVLFGVDFDVEDGDIVALLGTNGAGKSTLLRAISGVQEASNGAIFLDGQDITHAPPYEIAAGGVVMMPGGNAVFPTLTVEENLRAAAWMYREDEEYVRTRTEEVLAMFPVLRERLQQPAGNLSGGEQQMVALGQAFLMKPRLLMIDELSLGLAPQIVEQLLDTLRTIHAQGTTIILVEQSINVALTIAERAVFMEKGEIRFDGSTSELLRHPELVRSVFMGGAVTGSAGPPAGRRRQAEERERLLAVEDVAISFGGVQALRGVSIEVGASEIVGIIGPNGAGKTTLFDVISGFIVPDFGSVTLEATDVTNSTPDARARLGLGRSFQNARLFPSMTVRENIAVAFERRNDAKNPVMAAVWAPAVRRAERRIARRVEALIELLGLGAYADKFVNELSTGTRRTVDIACVMASEPRVLLLDEPSSGLAQAETEELGPVLTRLVRETGAGLLVIEHDLPLISSVSDRMYAMELGAVLVSGPPAEVMTDERVVSAYLAASESVLQRSGSLADLVRAGMGTSKTPNRK